MSKDRHISELREHLFDAIEKLKAGTIDVKQANAVAQLGDVIVQSAKVEVDYIKLVGETHSGFIDNQQKLLPEPVAQRALPEASEHQLPDIADRYGKVGDTYYGLVENQRGQRKLVAIPWRSLKERLGGLEAVPVYADLQVMEERLVAV
jgi:hypothetical protein